MNITRARVIMGDIMILIVLIVACLSSKTLKDNILAISLVLVILIARSIWYHISWYKTTGRLY